MSRRIVGAHSQNQGAKTAGRHCYGQDQFVLGVTPDWKLDWPIVQKVRRERGRLSLLSILVLGRRVRSTGC